LSDPPVPSCNFLNVKVSKGPVLLLFQEVNPNCSLFAVPLDGEIVL
jgi:hypothetical protein